MGKTDIVTKNYMRGSDIFADAFNFLIYNGEARIQSQSLQERDATELAVLFSNDSVKNEITDITAYYLGLTDYSSTVQEWGLGQSDYACYGDSAEQADNTVLTDNYEADNYGEDDDSSYGWWNMLDSRWEMSDWTYEDGEWYIYDEETGYFYIYMESYELFAALDEDDNLYYFDNETGEWVEE